MLLAGLAMLVVAMPIGCGSGDGGTTASNKTGTQKSVSDKEVQSDLRNAVMAMEASYTDTNNYTMKVTDLAKYGYTEGGDVVLTIVRADTTTYCVEAKGSGTQTWHYASKTGSVEQGPC